MFNVSLGGEPTAHGWYILQDNKRYGPYSEERMCSFIGEGRLKGDTLVWCEGMSNWARAADIEPFKSCFTAPQARPTERPAPIAEADITQEWRGSRRKVAAAGVLVVVVVAILGVFFLKGEPAFSEELPKELGIEAIGTVTQVHDGDTISIRITEVLVPHEGIKAGVVEKIRFSIIDTEETSLNSWATSKHPDLAGKTEAEYRQTDYYTHAISAKNLVENLCPVGGKVYLNIDNAFAGGSSPYRDSWGRIVAAVYVKRNGGWVNVIKEVLSKEYPEYCGIVWPNSEFDYENWLGISYLKITKDPSEMVLALGDLPSGYTVFYEYGYGNIYYRSFSNTAGSYLNSSCTKYASVGEAVSQYDMNKSYYSDNMLSLSENIGDQSFAFRELISDKEWYRIAFRKANVYAVVGGTNLTLSDLLVYARIMENKMN